MDQQVHLDHNRLTFPPPQSRELKNVRARGEKDNNGFEEAYEVSSREDSSPKRQLEASDSNDVEGPYEVSPRERPPPKRQRQPDSDALNAGGSFQDTIIPLNNVEVAGLSDASDVHPKTIRPKYQSHGLLILLDRLDLDPLELNNGQNFMFDEEKHPDTTLNPMMGYWEFVDREPKQIRQNISLFCSWVSLLYLQKCSIRR